MSDYKPGDFIYEEISSQADAWEQLIPIITAKRDEIQQLFEGIDEVLFTGCGSGLNAAMSGVPILQSQTGISSREVPAAEVYLFPKSVLLSNRQTLAILLSRSGETTEVVNALDYLQDQGIRTLGITCSVNSPLASRSDLALVLSPVTERAVATTRSVTGMILTLQLIAAIVSEDETYLNELQRLPALCESQMASFHDLGQSIGENTFLTKYAFVGSGPFFGQAHESQLKIKEMVLLPADAYPTLDFRHGPQSNVDSQMLITVFLSDSAQVEEHKFVRDMNSLGGFTWVICDRADDQLRENANFLLEVNSGLSELARGVLYMPAVQYMAYYRSLSCGLNPDEPRNLSYWVDTSG
ncbi:MAG: SIS domain-containing protein [Anaerolineaceae bacterium]|nr:MAG: SIS domain-containing protein [Anaerolineaceae bacterium]